MCDIVKTDSLLALLLSEHKEVSFRQLRLLRDRVVETNPDVLVDISGPSVDMAVHYYPQVFAVKGNGVIRARDAGSFFDSDYIREEFLSTVPQPVADQLLSCLQTAN